MITVFFITARRFEERGYASSVLSSVCVVGVL